MKVGRLRACTVFTMKFKRNTETRTPGNTSPTFSVCKLPFSPSLPSIITLDYLPIAALIENSILCVHGGLSPDIKTIDQMRLIERNQEIPHEGPFADMMWSDPDDLLTWKMSPRGAGWLFGSKVVTQFNQLNGLELICRAH